MPAPAAAVLVAFTGAVGDIACHLHSPGHELLGVAALRCAIADRYCTRGLPTEPDEVMVTSGALHALSLILSAYVRAGDRVLVEQPTYHGALSAIAASGARPVPVPMADGWDLDALHTTVRQLAPSLAYLMPDNHNPTGLTLATPERDRLGHIIARTRTRTIVDETMVDLALDGSVPAPLAAAMASRAELVLTVGSMSKSFWGGLRVGWIRADRTVIASIAALRPSLDMGTAILEQLAAAKLLADSEGVLAERRQLLRVRRAYLLELLAAELPDWSVAPGTGGMSLWVQLPSPMSSALSAAASRLGLELPAGPRFGVDGSLERFTRIPYTLPPEQLSDAVAVLARAWRSITGGAVAQRAATVV